MYWKIFPKLSAFAVGICVFWIVFWILIHLTPFQTFRLSSLVSSHGVVMTLSVDAGSVAEMMTLSHLIPLSNSTVVRSHHVAHSSVLLLVEYQSFLSITCVISCHDLPTTILVPSPVLYTVV